MRRLTLSLFVLVCVVQLAVPVSMIVERERILRQGEAFRFRTAPVDPYDAFRGRFVALGIEGLNLPAPDFEFRDGQRLCAVVETDEQGFARFTELRRDPPPDRPWLETRVHDSSGATVRIENPFSRYYLDEHRAPAAEIAYRDHAAEVRQAWVQVRILDGDAVLEELFIDGQPIVEYLRNHPR